VTQHAWSPDGRRLAFVGTNRVGLSVVDVASGRLRRLLPSASSFAWSPDGRRLVAFRSASRSRGLVVVDETGKRRPRLIVRARTKWWVWGWSPDGRAVAYGFTIRKPDADHENGREGLAIVDVSGKKRPRLVVTAEVVLSAAWSPDASRLAYVRIDGKYTCCVLHVVRRNGTNDRALAGSQLAQALSPSWSPDGRSLAYASSGQGGTGLHIVAADGSSDRALGTALDNIAWSPDGSMIAGTRGIAGEETRRKLVVVRADGSRTVVVATNATGPFQAPDFSQVAQVGDPVWSPNGQTIAYVGADANGLHAYRVDADGQNARQLTRARGSDTWLFWR
jgi:Tol biopolymer transport system component